MKFTFKPFKTDKESSKSPDQSLPPAQRRREQVRRAQKTHRERKEAYTKSLEAEVVQLHANEARMLHETKNLYKEIGALKRLLTYNGIPLPVSGVSPPLLSSPMLSPPMLTTESSVESSSSLDTFEPMFDFSIQQTKTKNRHERIYSRRGVTGAQQIDSSPTNWTVSTPSPRCLGEADQTAIGIDFVLALEAPCLGHHAIPPGGNAAANGHSLTVTATMLHEHPAEPSARLQSGSTWQIPAAGIERLLELSDSIPLDGELTPVQAWNHIRKHQHYSGLEFERLEALKQALFAHVKCHGFGGVIELGAFENAVFDAFVVGRVF